MVTVQIDEDDLLDMLMDRVAEWTNDTEVRDLYEKMYESYVDGGCFEGAELNIMSIVDNDYVNYCSTLCEEDCSEEDWKKLVELYEEGTRDISCEKFEDIRYNYVEAMNDERTLALMRS
jgi:hypothetical protein